MSGTGNDIDTPLIREKSNSKMDFSKVFEEIGEWGPYQCVVCILLSASMIPAVFSNLNTVFIMGVTDHWCAVPALNDLNSSETDIKEATIPLTSDGDGTYENCEVYVRNYSQWDKSDVEYYGRGNWDNASTEYCQNGWVYDTEVYGNTATTEFDLVCEMKWWQAASASAFALGMFFALLIYGTIADILGRKPILCWCTTLFIIFNFATAFSPNRQTLILFRFLCGFFSSPFYGGTFVLVAELIGPRYRAHVNAWFGYFWSAGGLVMCGLAYAIRDWKIFQLVLSAIMCIFLVYFLLPESPRWLYMKNRTDQADAIFARIAKSNKRTYTPVKFTPNGEEEEETGYIWHMFSSKKMTLYTIAMCFNWFAASLCYYGLTFASTSIGSNEYASFAISLLVETPAILIGHIVTVKVGRRLPLLTSMILGGIFLLVTLAFDQDSTGLVICVNLGKISCTLAFNLLYVYMVEVYPTVIRSVASSTGNFVARLGSILAPFIAQLSDYGTYLPLLIFGVCSLIAGLLALVLPETIDIELEDELESNQTNKDKEKSEVENAHHIEGSTVHLTECTSL